MQDKAVYFICADDEFIADTRAKELFEELSADITDDMSKEVIQGAATNASEATKICDSVIEATRTISMFGDKKIVWLRGLNFLNDSNGRSKDTQEALENLGTFASKLNPNEVVLLISAANVDKRKKSFKALKEASNFENYESADATESCYELIVAKSKTLGVEIERDAIEILVSTVAANPRMALQELEKLAAYVNFKGVIKSEDVVKLVPIFGEGDFFELTSLFYSGNITQSLAAIRRYFFTNKNASARPIIINLQRQNSLLIQIRALIDDGKISKTGAVSKSTFENLASKYMPIFKSDTKSSYNIFTQNVWYVSNKLAPIAARLNQKKLIDIQMSLSKAFEDLLNYGDEEVIKNLFMRTGF